MKSFSFSEMKHDTELNEAIYVVTKEDVGMIMTLLATCDRAEQLLGDEAASYEVLRIIDSLGIIDDEFVSLISELCDCDPDSILKVLWSLELGRKLIDQGDEVPDFAKLEMVRQMVSDLVSGKKVEFPFKEAESFIEKGSWVTFL